jgi:hypothetical protein
VSPGESAHKSLFDILPATIEVFYADRSLEKFRLGRRWLVLVASPARVCANQGGGWPFATRYSAYRHAMNMAVPFLGGGPQYAADTQG